MSINERRLCARYLRTKDIPDVPKEYFNMLNKAWAHICGGISGDSEYIVDEEVSTIFDSRLRNADGEHIEAVAIYVGVDHYGEGNKLCITATGEKFPYNCSLETQWTLTISDPNDWKLLVDNVFDKLTNNVTRYKIEQL